MKREFGNLLTRLFRGGTRLTDAEYYVLKTLVESLDPKLRGVVESHFEEYNLVQREVDARALNFYRVKIGGGHPIEVTNPLVMEADEEPLVRITLAVPGENPIHAVLTAVCGRAFCVTFDRCLPLPDFNTKPSVTDIKQSWRSEVRICERAV